MSLFRLHRDERGTEMIEAALTIPIVVTLLMGMVNLGITVYAGQPPTSLWGGVESLEIVR